MSRVVFFQSGDEHYWNVRSDNNRIVCRGEGHPTAWNAERAFINAAHEMIDALVAWQREEEEPEEEPAGEEGVEGGPLRGVSGGEEE